MNTNNWEEWAAATLGRRTLVEPPEFVVRRAVALAARRPRASLRPWLAAAATIFIAALGAIFITTSDRPTLPTRPVESTVRSGELAVLEPAGRLEAVPRVFAWEADSRAVRYSVKLHAVDDSVLFEESTPATSLELPPAVAATLHPAVSYEWTVEAVDASGAVVARSQRTRFEVRP